MFDLCFDCKRLSTVTTGYLCQKCNSKLLQTNWTSGNKYIDKFIQEVQLKGNSYREFIEWIPFNRLRSIKYLAHGGFSTIYKAIWLDGYKTIDSGIFCLLDYGDNENERFGVHVALKSLKNSSNINDDFLNEVSFFF
jgi:serine/threonine protein kinase